MNEKDIRKTVEQDKNNLSNKFTYNEILTFSKFFMVGVSIFLGLVVYLLLDWMIFFARSAIAIIVAFSNPPIGAYSIRFCYILKCWGYMKKVEEWSLPTKILIAAIWPLTLIYSITIYIFLGIINRLFK